MPRVLRKLRVDEVSAVIRAANPDARVMIQKSADELGDFLDDQVRAGKLPGLPNTTAPRRQAPPSPHPPGRAMPRPTQHEDDLMDTFSSVVRDHGLAKVAKAIAAGTGTRAVSEAEFTAEITKYARRIYPSLPPDVAFSRVFAAGDQRAQVLSKAVALVKNQAWLAKARARPQVASDDKLSDMDDEDRADMGAFGQRGGGGGLASSSGTRSAYDELMARAAELQRRYPAMSKAQCFEKIYTHPSNAQLAAAERRQNRPRVA